VTIFVKARECAQESKHNGPQYIQARQLARKSPSSLPWSVLGSISTPVVCSWVWASILTKGASSGAFSALTHVPRRASRACSIEATKEVIVAMKKNVWRAVIEVGFIIFLFYSNLLMGEFERSGMGQKRGVAWAIGDVFTTANFEIAMMAALIGYVLFEFLRKRF
jgi:hypothetical protein